MFSDLVKSFNRNVVRFSAIRSYAHYPQTPVIHKPTGPLKKKAKKLSRSAQSRSDKERHELEHTKSIVSSEKRTSSPSYKIAQQVQESIQLGVAHFRLGGEKVYFPHARVILLRPNAKHTPYQAKFIVPKSFNKLDLRDYLYHLYGLRALNITTQLLHGKYTRSNLDVGRYRLPQIKKMTVDMEHPFVWPEPEEPDFDTKYAEIKFQNEKRQRMISEFGEDKPTGTFDGIFDKAVPVKNFVSKKFNNSLKSEDAALKSKQELLSQEQLIEKHLGGFENLKL